MGKRPRTEPGEAAPLREGWGEVGPFEGFVPGIATAGALAAELARVVRGRTLARHRAIDESLTPAAVACLAALPLPDQVAFDAASLVIAELHAPEAVATRFEALARRWVGVPEALRQLAAVAVMLGAGEAVVRAERALSARLDIPRPGSVVPDFDRRLGPEFNLMDALAEQAFAPVEDSGG